MTTSLAPTTDSADSRAAFYQQRPDSAQHIDLSVMIGSLRLSNPVMPASGCFGPELGRLIPAEELGAAVTKTVFSEPRGGNLAHRLTEIPAGMVNSVGIPSQGPIGYLTHLHHAYESLGIPTIISVGGHRPSEYASVVAGLRGRGSALELNVSCPNLDRDGMDIGADPDAIVEVVRQVRQETDLPLIVKLSPMVPSISVCAQAAESAGASAVCVSNSLPSLPIDPLTHQPALGNIIGGLSGPSVRPIVLRLVWQSAKAVQIPVIACGGIDTVDDALEYFSVGASAVQVGTANFGRPFAMVQIARELSALSKNLGASSMRDLVRLWRNDSEA